MEYSRRNFMKAAGAVAVTTTGVGAVVTGAPQAKAAPKSPLAIPEPMTKETNAAVTAIVSQNFVGANRNGLAGVKVTRRRTPKNVAPQASTQLGSSSYGQEGQTQICRRLT